MTPKVVHPIREYSLMCTSNVAIHKNLPDRKTGIPEDNRELRETREKVFR